MTWGYLFEYPDNVGSSAYAAVYDHVATVIGGPGPGTKLSRADVAAILSEITAISEVCADIRRQIRRMP